MIMATSSWGPFILEDPAAGPAPGAYCKNFGSNGQPIPRRKMARQQKYLVEAGSDKD